MPTFLLFAGLPAAHEIIIGVGFFLRLRGAEFFATLARVLDLKNFEALLIQEALRLRGGFVLVREACRLRGADLRAASFRRFPPNPALICFADSFRRVAILLPFPAFRLAGF